MGTIWDPDCLSLAFGIGFRMRDGDDEAFLRKTDVLIAQTDQLSAAEGTREADEQERAVAGGSQIVWHSGKHLPQQFGRKRLFSLLRGPLHAPDAGHDGANELVLDRIGKAGKLVRLADGGQMPLDGRALRRDAVSAA